MSKQLSKYVVSTVKAIGYDIEEHVNHHDTTYYALTYNGFPHSQLMSETEIYAFAHGVSRALHAVNGEWRIDRVLEEMAKKEEAEKAKRCVDTTKKDDAAEGEEHHDYCDKCDEEHHGCCGKCVEGHNEYVVLDGESAFACMFADAMAVLDELSDMVESRKCSDGKDE